MKTSTRERVAVGPARTRMMLWFGLVVFGYCYKAFVFGFVGGVLGLDLLNETWIAGIDLNHWIEIVVYCPLLWFALHQVNADVFGEVPTDPAQMRRHTRARTIGEFAVAIALYGSGVHIANVVELYSRERAEVSSGDVYDLVYFLDEGLSHYLQFVPLFFLLGWFTLHDRIGRVEHPVLAVFFGVGHGVERAVGVTEGGKWFLVAPALLWLGWAVAARLRRAGRSALDEFFVRYSLVFIVTLPAALAAYRGGVGSFDQPSSLPRRWTVAVAVAAIVFTVVGTVVVLAGIRCAAGARRRLTRVEAWRSGFQVGHRRARDEGPVGHDPAQEGELVGLDALALAPGVEGQAAARARLGEAR